MSAPPPPGANAWAANMVALYVALIRSRTHFAQAVYGDGEWKNILGTGEGTNDQGEAYCEALGSALRRTLTEPVGQWGVLWPGRAGATTYQQARRWIAEHAPDVPWLPFRPLSWASVMGLAAPFLRAVRSRRVILVGPSHMAWLPVEVLDPAAHVTVPGSTAWRDVDRIVGEVLDAIRDDDIVLFSAGQGSCLMIHALWEELRGTATLIDTGSMWDPYCGIESRRVYTDDWVEEVMPRNIP